ncbi:MAG: hypothetical protein IT374_22930 [Polyangiaceae bacterium]|nr:hypothetical protein [Polyangiaceae bacterium]
MLARLEDRWGVGLRLPEIPRDELGGAALASLRPAFVDIFGGRERLARVGAIDLRPGVGSARVDIVPTLQDFTTKPVGAWPTTIDQGRWVLESPGVDPKGTLFRLCRGEWTRLRAGSAVHHGETLMVLADARCAPPSVAERHAHLAGGGLRWALWEMRLPDDVTDDVSTWLHRLGHEFGVRRWGVSLATPPRAYGPRGEPLFWLGDASVIELEAPRAGAQAHACLAAGTNTSSASVLASARRVAYVGVSPRVVGPAHLEVAADRTAGLEIAIVPRPSPRDLLGLLAQTPRLRVWVGHQCFEAWRGSQHRIPVQTSEDHEVRVDLGSEGARARVVVCARGKRHVRHSLGPRDIASVVEASLMSASSIEIDADNLGRVELVPTPFVRTETSGPRTSDRLVWRDHVTSMNPLPGELLTPTLLGGARGGSLASRSVGPAALVRARLGARKRFDPGRVVR